MRSNGIGALLALARDAKCCQASRRTAPTGRRTSSFSDQPNILPLLHFPNPWRSSSPPHTLGRMVNRPYVKGRAYEWERVRVHRSRGALLAVRTAGSRSPWDIFALYSNRVVLEQCKRVTETMPQERLHQEREFLAGLRVPPWVETYLVVRSDRGLTKVYPVHANGQDVSPAAPPAERPATLTEPSDQVPSSPPHPSS
jgi:hypothetical protein